MLRKCPSKRFFSSLILLTISITAFFKMQDISSFTSTMHSKNGNTKYKMHYHSEVTKIQRSSEDDAPIYPAESYGIKFLAKELKKKLDLAEMTPDLENITHGCKGIGHVEPDECNQTSVEKSCLQPILPVDHETRINQLVFKDNLQIADQYTAVIKSFTDQIDGSYDVIIASALSSNHFMESQAFLNSLHEGVFPLLTNYLLVMFNLGLTTQEKIQLQTHCRCTVIDFLFDKFPPHFKSLKCFAWKPIAVSAVYPRANVVIWADASVRFVLPEAIPAMVSKTKRQGIAARYNPHIFANPYYTLKQMFQYFGDSPCAHLPFVEVEMAFAMFHREPLIKKAVVDPWTACAINAACTCPVPQHTVQFCPLHVKPPSFGYCMRNDQSSMSIIMAKLFREKYYYFAVRTNWFIKLRRGDQMEYFKKLEKAKKKYP